VLLLGRAARAQEDLVPEEGAFAGYEAPDPYHLALRAALLGDDHYRLCQMVTVPSFEAEWAVYMTHDESGGYTVVSRTLKKHVWSQMMKALNKNGTYKLDGPSEAAALRKVDTAVVARTATVDEPTGQMLAALCGRVLLRVRYPKQPGAGLDGVTYHAATWARGAFPSGQTWSPKSGTLPAEFVALEQSLKTLTEAANEEVRDKIKADLKARAKRLTARLDGLEGRPAPRP
jgi:hypothetical protein